MNVISANPIVFEFLSRYPQEKHENCLLGIILFGIYNLKALSIDFSKILAQVEQSNTKMDSRNNSFLARVKGSLNEGPGDTPRFTTEPKVEKRSASFSKFNVGAPRFAGQRRRADHVKTPSIVNPDILNEMSGVENSEVLKIADQFLNGQFVNEYCKSVYKGKVEKGSYESGGFKNNGERRRLEKSGSERQNIKEKCENRTAGESLDMSGRRNSFSVVNSNRSVRGDRSSSYSKFW